MTVGELKAKLEQLDATLPVYVNKFDQGGDMHIPVVIDDDDVRESMVDGRPAVVIYP